MKRLLLRLAAPVAALGLAVGPVSPAGAVTVYPGEWICQADCNDSYLDPAYDTMVLRLKSWSGIARTSAFDTLLANGGNWLTVEIKYRAVSGMGVVTVMTYDTPNGWVCNTDSHAGSQGFVIDKCRIWNRGAGTSGVHVFGGGTADYLHVKFVRIVSAL